MDNVLTKVPIAHNHDGTVKTTENLITQYQQMTIEDLQRAAFARYDTALELGAPIPPASFTMRTLDPGNDADDKKSFSLDSTATLWLTSSRMVFQCKDIPTSS